MSGSIYYDKSRYLTKIKDLNLLKYECHIFNENDIKNNKNNNDMTSIHVSHLEYQNNEDWQYCLRVQNTGIY